MGAHVPAGSDTYRCKYVQVPTGAEAMVVAASHTASTGVHHVLVFRTDLPELPPNGDVERDCFAPDDAMPHARAQIYGAQTKNGAFALPPGVGLPLHAGEVLLLQAHDLNAGGVDLDVTVALHLETTALPVAQRAGTYFFADPFIDVGAAQKGRAAMRCVFPSSATLLSASAYAHTRATDFAAYLDLPGAPPSASPFYHAPGFANPLPLQTSLDVPAGAHVRVACAYDNSRGTTELLQGTRQDADEQCTLSGVYFPDLGADVADCRASPDSFGTGAATCAETRTCVDACPASSAPPSDLGLGRDGPIDPCWQRCMVASCADASALLFSLRACQASTAPSNCSSEAAACDADTCP
jgi:hypothetical protein